MSGGAAAGPAAPGNDRPMSLADALRAGCKRKNAAATKKLTGVSAANQSKRSRVAAAATEAAGAAVASFTGQQSSSAINAASGGSNTANIGGQQQQPTAAFMPGMPPMPPALLAAVAQVSGSTATGGGSGAASGGGRVGPSKNARTAAIAKTLNTAEVAAAASSMSEVIFARQRQWEEHHRQVAALRERIERIEQQCKTFKRTRRNIKSYNALLERHAQSRKELALLEMEEPNLQQFYADLLDFLQTRDAKDAGKTLNDSSAKEGEKIAIGGGPTVIPAGGVTAATTSTTSDTVISEQIGPLHRNLRVTAGAPILLRAHFDALAMQCCCRRNLTSDDGGADNAANNHSGGGTTDEDALFDAAIASDLRAHVPYESLCPILALLLSPTGTGQYKQKKEQDAQRSDSTSNYSNISERLKQAANPQSSSSSSTTNNKQAGGSSDLIMVTIGKAERGHHMPSGSENRNRLNVKMKDIRNMQNTSMMNYIRVDQRETTKEEQQHEQLVAFFSEREAQRAATQAPSYDDARCDACKEPLVVDAHTGMVACPNENCGLAYPDGVDAHRIEPIRHEYHSKFEYIKSGHLMTLLKRFQAKESTVIPRDVLDRVVRHLVDRQGYVVTRVVEHEGFVVPVSDGSRKGPNITTVTTRKLRSILKKLSLSRYYDHTWQLHWILTFIKPHQFSALEEQEFQAVFDEIEKVWPLFKPKNAENFIFYWFVIRKTAQLLGHPNEIVDSFPMLKNAKKHLQKEKLWQRMVTHIGWPYYESKHID